MVPEIDVSQLQMPTFSFTLKPRRNHVLQTMGQVESLNMNWLLPKSERFLKVTSFDLGEYQKAK